MVMTTHCPDHAFFPESRVVLLDRGGVICTGRGTDVVTEELIRRMYGVDNRIVVLNRGDGEAERCLLYTSWTVPGGCRMRIRTGIILRWPDFWEGQR